MTALAGKTTFNFELAKDPKRRQSRAGFNALDDTRKKSRQDRSVRNRQKGADSFVLYVEGARDREILGVWARRVDTALMRCIEKNTVILGGRRPARAIADFQKRGGRAAGYSGLVVLDRDDYTCQGCGEPADQVHHKTYERFGRERMDDLQSACGGCNMAERNERMAGGAGGKLGG